MLIALISVVAAIAVASWCVAVFSALSIVGMAPSGQKISTYFALGWWRFAQVESVAGPAAIPHIARYRKAFYVFFGCILAIAVTAILAARPEGS